jgi:hypothetical protein
MIDKIEEKQQTTNRIIRLERCFIIIEKKIVALEELLDALHNKLEELANG